MAFQMNAPFLTDYFKQYFPMKIYGIDEEDPLPCKIIEITETQDYSIPTEPVDTNTFVTDTIYINPKSISCQVFCTTSEYEDFEIKIQELQFSQDGIIIKGEDGQIYNNLRVVSIGTAQTVEQQGAYFYELEFIQISYVSARTVTISTKAPAPVKKKVQKGDKSPKKEPEKCAPKSLLKMGKDWWFKEKSCKKL